uniref:N-acetylneuraminate synthase n=1 Tax=Candidatus Kentrum sp. DK TaxID=2126562 RepID=A0A450TJY9_9GAMM|nr:MAG: N-acetylneuraminate synthase [Candidatus Kentron sp. DK]
MTIPFVAEVSSNHHQNLDRCLAFIDAAAAMGCDAVKFQLFRINELFAPEILTKSAQHRQRRQWELPVEFIPQLALRCAEKGIRFGCTPFYLDAARELEPYVAFYKIASYELLWDDLLTACAATGKPVVLATGMADADEVEHAVATLRRAGCGELTLLHCVSAYPAPPEECNLAAIGSLRERHGCAVGWSDHSVSSAVIGRAVHRWGAEMVEFHLDLDGRGEEFSGGHCWLPGPMGDLIASVKSAMAADGDGIKKPTAAELADRAWRADPADGLRPLRDIRET